MKRKRNRRKRTFLKPFRRMKNIHKIITTIQKHQEIYLNGLQALLYGINRFFKKTS